jgi:hypothetical protein
MMKESAYSREQYHKVLEFLLDYAHDDGLGFSAISPEVAALAGRGTSLEDRIPIFRKIISDLLDAGAAIGDFADTEGAPFVPWPGTHDEHLDRVEGEIRALGTLPMSGDIGWIFFPDQV